MKISKEKLIDIIKEELSAQQVPPAETEEEIKSLSTMGQALRDLAADISAGKVKGVTVAELRITLAILKVILESAQEGNIEPLSKKLSKYVNMGLGNKTQE